jgi:hypothetical protein
MADDRPLAAGDILLVRSHGAIPALIRYGERVRCQRWPAALYWLAKCVLRISQPDQPGDPWYISHAAVALGDGRLVEALANGLTLSAESKYSSTPTVVVRLEELLPDIDPARRSRVRLFALDQYGRHDRYGWLSIASIVLQLLTPLRLDLSWDGALICSAFAAQCAEHAGYVLPTRSALTTMPSDVARFAPQPSTPTEAAGVKMAA